ncbi:MAG TPA: hypothetical protein VMV92_35440 [Streptosporangiaceae bacterium]|nr:hypothetical protein [Streptosporangiaceae bacterium]
MIVILAAGADSSREPRGGTGPAGQAAVRRHLLNGTAPAQRDGTGSTGRHRPGSTGQESLDSPG